MSELTLEDARRAIDAAERSDGARATHEHRDG